MAVFSMKFVLWFSGKEKPSQMRTLYLIQMEGIGKAKENVYKKWNSKQ